MSTRTSSALAFALSEDGLVGFNFLQKSAFAGDAAVIDFLDALNRTGGRDNDGSLNSLVELGAVVDESSGQAALEKEFNEKWKWGLPAALFHFSVQGNRVQSLEEGEDKQLASVLERGLPALYQDNSIHKQSQSLPVVETEGSLAGVMARRRSNREPSGNPIQLSELAAVLYSGMAITGFTRNEFAELPLTMTPSGGARNPYEAYVIARNVTGLSPGFYHYSAIDHSLGCISEHLAAPLSNFVGEQDWADNMACIVVLAAFFERTMWKYDDPNAYRVVLIEAGHIGQNMLLTATDLGLAACPTAALNHELLFDCLNLPSRVVTAPVYAIGIGKTY
jgi:SagB-type dehydrogenase family enzyme